MFLIYLTLNYLKPANICMYSVLTGHRFERNYIHKTSRFSSSGSSHIDGIYNVCQYWHLMKGILCERYCAFRSQVRFKF